MSAPDDLIDRIRALLHEGQEPVMKVRYCPECLSLDGWDPKAGWCYDCGKHVEPVFGLLYTHPPRAERADELGRETIAELISEGDGLESRLARYREALERIAMEVDGSMDDERPFDYCAWCRAKAGSQHAPDCPTAIARTALKEGEE